MDNKDPNKINGIYDQNKRKKDVSKNISSSISNLDKNYNNSVNNLTSNQNINPSLSENNESYKIDAETKLKIDQNKETTYFKQTAFENTLDITEEVDDHIFINDNELGVQKYDIKFGTFEDPYINPLELRNITYKETEEELRNLICLVEILEKKFIDMTIIKEESIDVFFNSYFLCKHCSNINIIGLKRILTLSMYILKTCFEPLEKASYENLISSEFILSDEIYINNFFNLSNFKEIAKNNNEKFLLFVDTFKNLKKNENNMCSFINKEKVPSLTGISFAIKSINIYIESTIKDCESLITDLNEDVVVELFLNVKVYYIIAYLFTLYFFENKNLLFFLFNN